MNIQITNLSDHAFTEFLTLMWGLFFVLILFMGVIAYFVFETFSNLLDKLEDKDDDNYDYDYEMSRPPIPNYYRSETTVTTTKTKPTDGDDIPEEEGSDDD